MSPQSIEKAREKYVGFNDSHLAEKLSELEGITVSRETVRRVLRAAWMKSPQKRIPGLLILSAVYMISEKKADVILSQL